MEEMVHVLDLDDESIQSEHRTFPEIVSRVLHSHEAPVLERFRIKCYVRGWDSMDVRLWIATASARHLRELDLGVASLAEGYFRLPERLYSCKTLETLKLSSSVIVDVPSEACLKSLRTLHLLSACPKLEDLSVLHLLWVVSSISWNVWRNLLMLMLDRSPKLQVLKLDDRSCGLESSEECLLFHLETFVWACYKEHVEEQKCILRNACRLKRATVSIQGLNSDERLDLLEELQSVWSGLRLLHASFLCSTLNFLMSRVNSCC